MRAAPFMGVFLYSPGVEPGEIRQTAVEVRENAETLIDGDVNALNDAKYLAAQVAALAHAVEELAKKLENP